MMRLAVCVLFCASLGIQAQGPAGSSSPPLPALVATERAFAAAAAEMGVRNAFLTFFADDAVATEPSSGSDIVSIVSARTPYLRMPWPIAPPTARLDWRPATGQIATDGSLGWLTGPYANHEIATGVVRSQGAYFSVWRRQADGTWRVWLDLGISLPAAWNPGADFAAAVAPVVGDLGAESIDRVEESLAGKPTDWGSRLEPDVRVHVDGQPPIVGADRVRAWQARQDPTREVRTRVVISDANDMAVVLGGYERTLSHLRGTFVRVWQRDRTGRWTLVFETRKPLA